MAVGITLLEKHPGAPRNTLVLFDPARQALPDLRQGAYLPILTLNGI